MPLISRSLKSRQKKATTAADVDVDVDDDAPHFIETLHASPTMVQKDLPCVQDQFNYPFDSKSASFLVPSNITKQPTSVLEELQRCLTENYLAICGIVEGPSLRTPRRNWGATAIQGIRYMIRLDGDDCKCWEHIVKKYKLPSSLGTTLLDMAKTASDSGSHIDKHQVYSQFYILFTANGEQQEPHIDLFSPLMQYGMILTPGEYSTIVYDNTSIEDSYQVNSLSRLVKFLGNKDIYPPGVSRPSTKFLKHINRIPVIRYLALRATVFFNNKIHAIIS
jgi:hypothetical protein